MAAIKSMSEKEDSGAVYTEKSTTPSQDEGLPTLGSQERLLAERRLVRRLDMWLMPTIFIIFIMNYIDVSHAHFCSECDHLIVDVLVAQWCYDGTTKGHATGLAYQRYVPST